MKWEDVDRFLITEKSGSIQKRPPKLEQEIVVPSVLKDSLAIYSRFFQNKTEMEAMMRVLSIVSCVLPEISTEIKVHLQPSVENHPCVTDILLVKDGTTNDHITFIEVKRSDAFTSLGVPTAIAAQAVREAHILCSSDQTMPFVVTNSILWSFGKARKMGEKLKLIEYFDVTIQPKRKLCYF